MQSKSSYKIWLTVGVAALGYFVDIYDIQVFRIIGIESLRDGLKIPAADIPHYFNDVLYNWQMGGMLVGGLIWGIMGDRLGRRSVLFGAIIVYSLANISNAFVTTIEQYAFFRFVAGLGLAGELGAAITITSEIMTKENRGYGTVVIVAIGTLGAVFAVLISKKLNWLALDLGLQPWQLVYIVGGVLGLILMLLRFQTFESGMFDKIKKDDTVKKGDFFMLFRNIATFKKYLYCILMGLPIWFVVALLIGRSIEIGKINGITSPVDVSYATMFCYIGISVGDLISAWLSQILKSRRKVIGGYIILNAVVCLIFLYGKNLTIEAFYVVCFLAGTMSGYWALYVTVSAEQFGTNIRATVAITSPNFVRGAVIPITLGVTALSLTYGTVNAAAIVGAACLIPAFYSILMLEETYGKDLNYLEVN